MTTSTDVPRSLPLHTNNAGYTVPDVTYKDPRNRRIRVVTVGAGYSGILIAYKLSKETQNIDHVIYEKNGDVGGAWLENRYPNCACDVPSHSYVYDFALNPYWPELYSKSDHIWKYLDRVCRAFDLRRFMIFNSKLVSAVWSQELARWQLQVEITYSDESTEIINDHCDVLLQASGLLNNPNIPKLEGLNRFKGRVIHTAQWPDDFGPEQWKTQNIGVIGGGASAVQTVPGLQEFAKHIDLYVRSKTWLASAQGENTAKPYWSPEEQEAFATDPSSMVKQARIYEERVNMVWKGMMSYTPEQANLVRNSKVTMEKYLVKPGLASGFVPDFAVGCRRTTPGIPFMKAVNEPNVEVHFTAAERLTEHCIIGADGSSSQELDTIVCATGFDTTYRPRFNLVGQDGISLAEKFTPTPESYFGVSCPGFPNYLNFFGPTFPVLAGSVTASLSAVADLAIAMIRKIQLENIRAIAPSEDATRQFNEHTQAMLRGTVWEDSCNSWYKNKNGRITAVWPGSALHFQDVLRTPRWEDWNIDYMNKQNKFAYLGLGFTNIERDETSDKAPYMNVSRLDPAFYDFNSTPLRSEAAPTAAQARKLSLRPRPSNGENGAVTA